MPSARIASLALVPLASMFIAACGGSKTPAKGADDTDAEAPSSDSTDSTDSTADAGPKADPITGEKAADSKPCEGFELDLNQVLAQAACVAQRPATDKDRDPKGTLDVKIIPSRVRIAKGDTDDLTIIFTNKGKDSFPLWFNVDPDPRIEIEVYNKKTNKRVDAPKGNEPPLPESVSNAPAAEKQTARATLVTNGTAQIKVNWPAVKFKWASKDRAKGAIPGRGYPKEADVPLPKGKYIVKVILPMFGVFEGLNHEVTTQQTEIEIQ
jgi:hypothetical protein